MTKFNENALPEGKASADPATVADLNALASEVVTLITTILEESDSE